MPYMLSEGSVGGTTVACVNKNIWGPSAATPGGGVAADRSAGGRVPVGGGGAHVLPSPGG